MTQLESAKKHNNAVAYFTLQGNRYGYCPFPNIILESEFREIKVCLQRESGFEATLHFLGEPYWRLDETAFAHSSNGEKSNVYILQPVSSLPGCKKFFIWKKKSLVER